MIFSYFKNKRNKELDLCERFYHTYNHLNKNQTMSGIAVNRKNFRILKKFGVIKKVSRFFDEWIIYRVINKNNKKFWFSDVEIFLHSYLLDDEVEFIYNYQGDGKMKMFTKDEIAIQTIIE